MQFDFNLSPAVPPAPGVALSPVVNVKPVVTVPSMAPGGVRKPETPATIDEPPPGGRFEAVEQGFLATGRPALASFRQQCARSGGQIEDRENGPGQVCDVGIILPGDAEARPMGPFIKEYLAKFPVPDQERFGRIAAQLNHDDIGSAMLQNLLLSGRLVPSAANPPNAAGKTLLAALDDLAAGPKQPGIDGAQLLGSLIREIRIPASISQEHSGTCTVTSLQTALARENPAEYVRVLAGLAAPGAGTVDLAGNGRMSRVPGSERPGTIRLREEGHPPRDVPDGRSVSSRLFQSAAMQRVHPPGLNYSVRDDAYVDASGHAISDGLAGEASARLSNALGLTSGGRNAEPSDYDPATSAESVRLKGMIAAAKNSYQGVRQYADAASHAESAYAAALTASLEHPSLSATLGATHALDLREQTRVVQQVSEADLKARGEALHLAVDKWQRDTEPLKPKLVADIETQIRAGREVRAGVAWFGDDDWHSILVTAIDAQTVTFNNPHGSIETMPRAEFERRIRSATLVP